MTMRFQCPNCAARLGTADEQQALRVDCPRCHTTLLVPDMTAVGPTSRDGYPRGEEAAVDFHSRRKVADAEVDMTPMVDVTFLLLIFFMVTAAFSLQKSFQIPTPKEERASTLATLDDYQDDPEFVVVRIDENSTFYISASGWEDEREAPSEQDLRVGLSDARSGDGHGQIPTRLLVVAHGSAVHGRVVTAMDAGTDVGMEDVKLVTVEEDES